MSCVRQHLDAGVLTLTLADEANRNALGASMREELGRAFDAANNERSVRVVVVTNIGKTFCAGADLREKAMQGQSAGSPSMSELFDMIRHSNKPYVGKLAGHCVAGGVGLAAVMDISVAAEDAMFGFTEVRIGVSPAIISVICLPKMRAADAREAFLRGNRFDAREAARLGLINRAVPRDALDLAVDEVTHDLIAGGPEALAATKQVLAKVPGLGFGEAMQWTTRLSGELFSSSEGQAGIAAYREKRKAPWITNNI